MRITRARWSNENAQHLIMRTPPLLARQPTRRLDATRWRPAAHLRCSSPPFSTPQCLLSTSAVHRTPHLPPERPYEAHPPREPPVPSPACSPPSIRPAAHARNNELLERLVECIPRAPVCLPVSSLYLLFTIDDATTPVLFESPWNVINSASETTPTAVAAPESSAKEKRASQLACARPSPISATAFSAPSREASLNTQRRRNYVQETSRTLSGLLLGIAGENLADELLSSVNGRGSVRAHGVYMSFDSLYATVASSAEEAGRAFAALYAPLTPENRGELESNLAKVSCGAARSPSDAGSAAGDGAGFRYADMCCPPMVTRQLANNASALPKAPERFAELGGRWLEVKKAFFAPSTGACLCGPDAYLPYFGDAFEPPPPPALPVAATRRHGAATSFSPSALAAMLPTYFVPVVALLKQLPPGYTSEHVRRVFGETMALEMVELANETYVRFYGGKDGEGFTQGERTACVGVDEDAQASANDGNNSGDFDDDDAVPAAPGTSALATHSGEAVHQYIAAYEPDPYLFYSFLPRFPRPFQWIPLYDVVEHAPPAVKAALLPLCQRSTLLYFAQQQHRMQFTAQKDGAVCLSFPPVRSLRAETTPLPRELAEVQRLLQTRGLVYVSEMEAGLSCRISDGAQRSIIAYFGTLRRFLYQHESVFRLSVVPSTNRRSAGTKAGTPPAAMPRSSAPTLAGAATQEHTQEVSHEAIAASAASSAPDIASTLYPPPPPMVPTRRGFGFAIEVPPISTVEEDDAVSTAMLFGKGIDALDANGFPHWLASADLAVMCEGHAMMQHRSGVSSEERQQITSRHKRSSQKIRRRMALVANPNSPYTDPEVLLDAILRYLPPTRHIGLRSLLQALPPAITDFLPTDPIRLFRNAPTKVQLFEFRERNNIRLMRPGLPLPDGRLRSSYTVDELLHMLAAELPPGRSRTSVDLFGRLPYGARETIRLQHRHLINLVEQYPQYFVVVYADAESAKKNLARVQIIQNPPPATTLSDDEWEAKRTTVSDDMLQAAAREDHAILTAELSPSLRETLNLKPMR